MTTKRPIPPIIADLKAHEGKRLVAYDDKQPNRTKFASVNDVIGVPTVGWGHTSSLTKRDVVRRRKFTEDQITAFLVEDMQSAVDKIYACLPEKAIMRLTDNQYAALVSFAFNCGLSSKWTITRKIAAGSLSEVPDQMIRFVYDDGKRLQGLVNRRRAEIDLWRKAETIQGATDAKPQAQRGKPLMKSRTFVSSMVSGLSGVGTGVTAAITQLSPFADDGILKTVLVVLVIISTLSAFLAATFRAQDAQEAKA